MSAHWAVLWRPPRLWWPLRRGLVRPPAWPQRCSPLRLQVTCRHGDMHALTLISEMKNNQTTKLKMLDSYSEIWNNLWLVSNCTLPNCFCSTDGTLIPGGLLPTDVPQEYTASENIIFKDKFLNTSIWPLKQIYVKHFLTACIPTDDHHHFWRRGEWWELGPVPGQTLPRHIQEPQWVPHSWHLLCLSSGGVTWKKNNSPVF